MKKIDKVNECLIRYALDMKDAYSLDDSLLMERLLQKTRQLSYPCFDTCKVLTFISREHTIILMKRFLASISDRLSHQFSSLLSDGCIYWIQNKHGIHKAGYYGRKPFIKLSLSYTLHDFVALVHEFFHLTNRKFSDISYPATRETFSEFVSIYFEKQAILFLEREGYSSLELSFLRHERWMDTCYTIHRYHFENTIWKVYQREGAITFANAPYKIDKIYRYFQKYTFSPFKKMVYILGDILSEYVLDVAVLPIDILNLNFSLQDFSIFAVLEQIGGNFDFSKVEEILSIYQSHILENISGSCQ